MNKNKPLNHRSDDECAYRLSFGMDNNQSIEESKKQAKEALDLLMTASNFSPQKAVASGEFNKKTPPQKEAESNEISKKTSPQKAAASNEINKKTSPQKATASCEISKKTSPQKAVARNKINKKPPPKLPRYEIFWNDKGSIKKVIVRGEKLRGEVVNSLKNLGFAPRFFVVEG